jgi:hypothetical protein
VILRVGATELQNVGFTLLPGLVVAAELEHLCALADAKLREPLPAGCERPHNTLAPLRWNDRLVASVLGCEQIVQRIAAASDAGDLRWISGYVSVKDGSSPPLGWHQDWWCWTHPVSFRARPCQIAVLCYLADTGATSGALRVLPETHRRSVELHAALADAVAEGSENVYDAVAQRDQPGQRTLAVAAGDAVAIDYRLLHGTHANETATRRDCLILNFAPDWSDLPDEMRAHLIRHPALPQAGRATKGALARLLPDYDGAPRDLPLARTAPDEFATGPAA